ncbi:MAG: hypothetical protein HKN51_09350 [Saprospiraceae bacterium]|nr:hypothetical protein [Saprospiraceae bacterium]
MRTTIILTITMLYFTSCKKDCQTFENGTISFFTEHKDFVVIDAEFEAVEEVKLLKEAHKSSGAKFETVTEQVLERFAYTEYNIKEEHAFQIVSNAETNTIQKVICYHFLDESDFIKIENPNEYRTRTYKKVIDEGTGFDIAATYETDTFYRLVRDAELIPTSAEREFESYNITFPGHMTLEEYIRDQLEMQNISECEESISFRLN